MNQLVIKNTKSSGISCELLDPLHPDISGYDQPKVAAEDMVVPLESEIAPIKADAEKQDDAKQYMEFLQGISGMPITTPILGRISLGGVYEAPNGRMLPKKEDHFTITSLVKNNRSEWVNHPLHDTVLDAKGDAGKKLRIIPIKLMYDSVDLNLQDSYTCFNDKGRMVCTGDGNTFKRVREDGTLVGGSCPGSTFCSFGRENRCKQFGRFYAQVEGQDDMFSAFVLRTTGWNSINNLRFKLSRIKATFGYLSHIPLKLVIRTKCAAQSYWTPFFFADIVVGSSPEELVSLKNKADASRKLLADVGFDFLHGDELGRYMLRQGALFEDGEVQEDIFQEHFSFVGSTEADTAGKSQTDDAKQSATNSGAQPGKPARKKHALKPKGGMQALEKLTSDPVS